MSLAVTLLTFLPLPPFFPFLLLPPSVSFSLLGDASSTAGATAVGGGGAVWEVSVSQNSRSFISSLSGFTVAQSSCGETEEAGGEEGAVTGKE